MIKGVDPIASECSAAAMGAPQPYWDFIMSELVGHGFLDEVNVSRSMSGTIFVNAFDPKVTMEGVEFAQENTAMAKAKKFLMDAKSSIPFV